MQNSHDIIICPHPLKARHEIIPMPEGLTIAQMIEQGQPDPRLRQYAHVHVDGYYIQPGRWDTIKPPVGSQIEIRMVPAGGDGKNPLRTILTIVVMAVAIWVGAGAGGLITDSFAAGMAGAAVGIAGSLLINAIAPPPDQDLDPDTSIDEPNRTIEGARNRARLYAPIRKLLGKNRIVPDYAALPYTEIKGDDHYLRMLFCWGYGPLNLSDLRIGETPIEEYDGIQIEHRLTSGDPPLTLYPNTVNEESLSIELIGGAGWTTRTTQQETDVITVDIAFPSGLVQFSDKGDKWTLARDFEIQYSPAGEDNWSYTGDTWHAIDAKTLFVPEDGKTRYIQANAYNSGPWFFLKSGIYISDFLDDSSFAIAKVNPVKRFVGGGPGDPAYAGWVLEGFEVEDIRDTSQLQNSTDFEPDTIICSDPPCPVSVAAGSIYTSYVRFEQKSTSAVRRSIQFDPGARGQYDVRIRRITPNENDDSYIEDSYWTALRSIKNEDPVNRDDVALTAIRIKATGQLNGVIDELNGICESMSTVWDDTAGVWVDNVITRNPASHFLEMLQGNGIGESALGDDRIDLENIKDFQAHCTDKDFTCDLIIENRSSVRKHLHNIAAAGRASVTNIDGKWGVVMDRKQTVYHQHVTPRNSWDFMGEKEFEDIPHAIKIRFRNAAKGYQQDTVIAYDDGYSASNATKYEEIQRKDVTDSDLAWRHGRFHLASIKLRPEVFSFKQDVEYIKATRGDLIKFAHTVPMLGLKSCRVKSVSINASNDVESVTVDDICTMEAGKTYFMRFRLSDDTSLYKEIQTAAGENYTLSFVTPFDAAGDIPAEGDLAMFGESDLEAIDLIIRSIDPMGDLSAKVTCVHAAPEIHDADTGAIPAFDSQISEPSFPKPPQPEITKIRSDERVLVRDADGSLRPSIVVDFSIPGNFQNLVRSFQVSYREISETTWNPLPRLDADARSFRITDVEESEKYDMRIRSAIGAEEVSPWAYIWGHNVIGKSTPPQAVTGFQAVAARDRIELSWYENPDPDIGKYEIREGSSWADSDFIARIKGTSHQTREPSNGPWWVKAIDTAGNYSANATQASIVVTLPDVINLQAQVISNNVLLRWDKELGTFDLDRYEIRKGDTFSTAVIEGTADVTFYTLTEFEGGEKTYWVIPIDAAGNHGLAKSVTLNVDDPPDFVLRNQFQTDWQGNVATNITPQFSVPLPARLTDREFSGLEFDGVDDYANVPDDSTLDPTGDFTVEAWIFPLDVTVAGQRIIEKDDGSTGWALSLGDPGDGSIRFYHRQLNVVNTDTPVNTIRNGLWTHVAAVFDAAADTTTIFVDGVQKAQETGQTNAITGNSSSLKIGDNFNGRISEKRLWKDVARTQAQIQDNMHRTLIGDETGLVAYYRMQIEATGDLARDATLEDMSGNDNDGVIYGATRKVPDIKAIAPHDNLSRDELIALGYNSRDDMITAGYNYRAQPAPLSAQFIEYYDAGSVIPATAIQVTPDLSNIVGTVSATITISVRETQADAWTDFTAGNTLVVAKDFRYVKITMDLSVSADTDFAVLSEIRTSLKTKLRTDSGTATVSSNPTTVPFNVNFIDINSIVATPQGDTSLFAIVDFTDVVDPSGFDVYLFDNAGNAASGLIRWNARGI